MKQDIYESLQERINEYGLGYCTSKSGVELKILQMLFTPEEAELYLHMSQELEPIEIIANRAHLDVSQTSIMLDKMTKKGVTFPIPSEGRIFYAAAPFMHGFVENAATLDGPKELMVLFDEYLKEGFKPSGKALRTIPIHESLEVESSILPFDDVLTILQQKGRIGVIPCACAKKAQILEKNCSNSIDVCIAFDFYAEYAIEGLGLGRWITKEEALTIIKKAEKEGLVHQIAGTTERTEAICNCCPTCCNSLSTIKHLPAPSRLTGPNYSAVYNPEDCILCGICVQRCPMGAYSIEDDVLSLNADRCIGCGLCVTTCSVGALSLERREESKLRHPPSPDTYKFMKSSVEYEKDVSKWMKN